MKKIDTDRIPAEAMAKIKAKAEARIEPIDNSKRVEEFRKLGGQIIHVRPRQPYYPGGKVGRGMTAAFVVKSGRVEIATAIQHRSDDFTKKVGTKTAIEHFNAGKTITLPIYSKGREAVRDLSAALLILC